MAFKDNILTLRRNKSLRQKDVAKKLEVKVQQISNYENGKSWVSEENLYKLAELFEVPVWKLFYDALDENITPVSEDSTRLKELSLRFHEERDKREAVEAQNRRLSADLEKASAEIAEYEMELDELRTKIFKPVRKKKKPKN